LAALAFPALALCSSAARAQSQSDIMLPQVEAPAPDAAALRLARALVDKTASNDVTSLPWLGMPAGMFMRQLHITPREHARIVFREALLPVLQKHLAEFHEIEAETYAAAMSVDDLKAANAFYDSPAGLALLRMHDPLVKLNSAAVEQLLQTLKPEIQTRVDETLKAHGWSKG
jgi:hypothetical protein